MNETIRGLENTLMEQQNVVDGLVAKTETAVTQRNATMSKLKEMGVGVTRIATVSRLSRKGVYDALKRHEKLLEPNA